MEKELLMQLIGKCYEINTTTQTDIFLEYTPHVNYFSVYAFPGGWHEGAKKVNIANCSIIEAENIKMAIKKLEELEELLHD